MIGPWEPFAFTAIDVLALTGFQLLSTDGIYPLLIMTLLPVLVGLDVSSRRAAVVLAFTLVGFAVAVVQDPVMVAKIGWPEAGFRFLLYAFLCGTALIVVRIEEGHVHSVAGLSTLREELLAQTMTASEDLQRRISESIHDGPLQDILAVRQELVELDTATPGDERVTRALAGLQVAAGRLRQATFELHPAVLEQVGLSAAVEQLAAFTGIAPASRSSPTSIIRCETRSTPSCSVWFVSCCLMWCAIRRPAGCRSRSGSPTTHAGWMWPTTASGSRMKPLRAASGRDTSASPRIEHASMLPAEHSNSSMCPRAPMSMWKYRFSTDAWPAVA